MAERVWWKTAMWVIAIFSFFIIFLGIYGPEGLFEDTKDLMTGVINITVGAENITGEKPTIPEEHRSAVNKLTETIKKMISSKETNCFANYGELPELGEKGTVISFQLKGDKTVMTISGGAGGKQEVSREEIDGLRPCVIAGKSNGEDVSENFYYTFLESDLSKVKGNFYSPVTSITIAYDTSGFNENRINFGDGFKDFEDGAWLFKADNGNVCFFPTKDGLNGEEGLDDDYVSGEGEHSVRHVAQYFPCYSEFSGVYTVYHLEHDDDAWTTRNLEWRIVETSEGLKITCEWNVGVCGYNEEENDVEGLWLESDSQLSFAKMMNSVKKWSDIVVPAGEEVIIEDDHGKKYTLDELKSK